MSERMVDAMKIIRFVPWPLSEVVPPWTRRAMHFHARDALGNSCITTALLHGFWRAPWGAQ